jgi:DNA polymerase-3 subunit delta'
VFDDVLGHEEIRSILERALRQGRLPPALLLSGSEGIGKRTLAVAVGRALLCLDADAPGCGVCSHCRRIDSAIHRLPEAREAAAGGRDGTALNHRLHPDFIFVEPWTTTKEGTAKVKPEIRVDQVRDLVAESFARPFEAKARCIVVDDAHWMNPSSANSLLKSLEEPAPTTHFLLCTGAPQALLPTIRSRCQALLMKPLPQKTLEAHLREARGLPAEEARLRAVLADGSLGRALAFESGAYRTLRELALQTLEERGNGLKRLENAEKIAEADDQLPLLLGALRSLLRDVGALRAGVPGEQLLNPDLADRLRPLSHGALGAGSVGLAERIGETLLAIQGNAQKLLAMDVLLDAPELRG